MTRSGLGQVLPLTDARTAAYFADAGFEPKVSDDERDYGALVGEKAWVPSAKVDLRRLGRTLALVLAPPTHPVPTHVLYEDRLLEG